MIWHLVELVLYACAAVGMWLTHRHTQQRLEEQAGQRAAVLQKQAKAVNRLKRQAVEEFKASHADTQRMHEDTALMHRRADALLREVKHGVQ